MFTLICILQTITNAFWKYGMSSKQEANYSWKISALDGIFTIYMSIHLHMYQLLALEVFFLIVSLLKLTDKLKTLHFFSLLIVICIIYVLNTINPIKTLELLAVVFFLLCIYCLVNKNKFYAFLFLSIGSSILIKVLYEKDSTIFLISQIISVVLAIRGMWNYKNLMQKFT